MRSNLLCAVGLSLVVIGCSRKDQNPAVPKGPTAAIERIEGAMAETRRDVFATPYRNIGETMIPDMTLHLQTMSKGTPLEADTNELQEMANKFAKLSLNPRVSQKKLQDAFNELDAKFQAIKAKVK